MSDPNYNPELAKTAANKLGSNWSLGWGSQGTTKQPISTSQIKKYHNTSQLQFQDQNVGKQFIKKDLKQNINEQYNKKLPTYDPKQGGKTSIHLGDEKVDYRHKNEVYSTKQTNQKNQPTNSQIKFG